jgi:phosphoribosylaminoimidazole (AIR) synthetase
LCAGGVSAPELLKTFNCGIGAIIIVSASDAESVLELITRETPCPVGTVEMQTGEGKWYGHAVAVTCSQRPW